MSFGKVIRMNVLGLKLSGAISLSEKTSWKRMCSYVLHIVAVISFAVHSYSYVREFVINAAYLETATGTLAASIGLVGGFVRYLIIYVRRYKIRAMLRSFDDLWQQLDATEQRCVTSFMRDVKICTYFFLSQCGSAIFFYTVATVLANAELTSNSTTPMALPYPCFIENVTRSPYYEVLFFLQVSSMINVGLTCVGIDMLSPMVIIMTSGHLRVLQHQFDAIGRRFNNSTMRNLDTIVSKDLESCVIRHWKIFSICTDIEDLTNIIFLTQLLGSTVILATVCFKMAGDNPDKYKYFPQMTIVLVQLFIANWPPDVLMSESAAVADAVYRLPWYQWPCEVRKSVQVIITRSQRPVRLTAGKFVTMSFETFASMVSSAMSLLAALRTFN